MLLSANSVTATFSCKVPNIQIFGPPKGSYPGVGGRTENQPVERRFFSRIFDGEALPDVAPMHHEIPCGVSTVTSAKPFGARPV